MIAILFAVGSLVNGIQAVVRGVLGTFASQRRRLIVGCLSGEHTIWTTVYSVAIAVLSLIAAVLLIAGVRKRNRKLMLPAVLLMVSLSLQLLQRQQM